MKARILFQRLTSREKTLLCAFVWVILIIFFAFALKNFRGFIASWQDTSRTLSTQQGYLDNQPQLIAQLKQELEFFKSDQILNSAALAGRVDQLPREVGIRNFSVGTVRSTEQDIHIEHSVKLTVRDAPLDQLMALDAAFDRESPYINKVNVQLTANRSNEELLDAVFTLNSFELKPSGFAVVE